MNFVRSFLETLRYLLGIWQVGILYTWFGFNNLLFQVPNFLLPNHLNFCVESFTPVMVSCSFLFFTETVLNLEDKLREWHPSVVGINY